MDSPATDAAPTAPTTTPPTHSNNAQSIYPSSQDSTRPPQSTPRPSTPVKGSVSSDHRYGATNPKLRNTARLRQLLLGSAGMKRRWASIPVHDFLNTFVRGHDLPDSVKHKLLYEPGVVAVTAEAELYPKLCTMIDSVIQLVAVLKTFGSDPETAVARYLAHTTSQKPLEDAYAALDEAEKGDMAPRDTSHWKEKGGDFQRDIIPDCGVYPTPGVFNPEDIADSDAANIVKRTTIKAKDRHKWLGRVSWANMLVPIEAKVNPAGSAFQPPKAIRQKGAPTKTSRTSTSDPAIVTTSASQSSANSTSARMTVPSGHAPAARSPRANDVLKSGSIDVVRPTLGGTNAEGQIVEYIAKVFAHQHRTHLFTLYVFKSYACLLYSDRVGTIVSGWFPYGTSEDTTLQDFFYRFAWMTSEEQGLDPSARRVSPEEAKKMLACAESASLGVQKQVHDAIGWDETTKSFKAASQWPFYEITISERTFLVGRPLYVDTSAVGRCTRAYVARDVQQDRLCVLKDSWRPDIATHHPEHLTYQRLQENGVQFVLSCEVGGDVQAGSGSDAAMQGTQVQSFLDSKPVKRIHYRIVLKEVCLPVTEFTSFRDLAYIMCTALLAHKQAWENAGVLHRDISVGNILIYEDSAGQCAGFLSDWDLCKYEDELATGSGPPDRTGTWQFRSALSLRYPKKPYSLPDDIESFIHVFHYVVIRHAITDQTTHLKEFVRMVYDECTLRELDNAHVGGATKLKHMDVRVSPIVPLGNPTLGRLLQDMAGLCNDHRNQITLTTFDKLYGVPDPLSIQMLQASTPAPVMNKTPAGNAAIATILAEHPRAIPSGLSELNVPALVSSPSNPDDLYGASPFRTHGALLRAFAEWHSSSAPWEGDVKSEDLFAIHMQSSGRARSAALISSRKQSRATGAGSQAEPEDGVMRARRIGAAMPSGDASASLVSSAQLKPISEDHPSQE